MATTRPASTPRLRIALHANSGSTDRARIARASIGPGRIDPGRMVRAPAASIARVNGSSTTGLRGHREIARGSRSRSSIALVAAIDRVRRVSMVRAMATRRVSAASIGRAMTARASVPSVPASKGPVRIARDSIAPGTIGRGRMVRARAASMARASGSSTTGLRDPREIVRGSRSRSSIVAAATGRVRRASMVRVKAVRLGSEASRSPPLIAIGRATAGIVRGRHGRIAAAAIGHRSGRSSARVADVRRSRPDSGLVVEAIGHAPAGLIAGPRAGSARSGHAVAVSIESPVGRADSVPVVEAIDRVQAGSTAAVRAALIDRGGRASARAAAVRRVHASPGPVLAVVAAPTGRAAHVVPSNRTATIARAVAKTRTSEP